MACDKPTGDCTNVSPCGTGCAGCSGGTTPAPVLPKCQDVSLAPGVYTNATVTINQAGCISAVAKGEPEQYTPDDCCGGSGGGSGENGARGPKGDPGAAATVDVQSAIGTGATWSVENVGTTSAAVFKFTAPASTGGGSSGTGATGDVDGFVIVNGLVQDYPNSLVTEIESSTAGVNADLILFQAVPSMTEPGKWEITLNLDLFFDSLNTKITELKTDLEAAVDTIASLQNTLATQQGTISSLVDDLQDLRAEFNAYVAANP